MILEKLDGTLFTVKASEIKGVCEESQGESLVTVVETLKGVFLVKESKQAIQQKIQESPRQLLCD